MNRKIMTMLIACLLVFLHNITAQTKQQFSGNIGFGYNNGFGIEVNLMLRDFAEGFPLALRTGFGIAFIDPGKPMDARKIFINDNTNGVPEESGKIVDLRFDFMLPLSKKIYLFAGPRYSMFTGNFKFVGGNEDFDVSSNQWAAGVGAEGYFKVSSAFDLVLSLGYDFYFKDALYGHDTTYTPDNENINSRKEFEYKDADDAINQPNGSIRAMFGLSLNL
ncbi:MAG: hypothetical protein V1720_08735 [bacterium]